ncbi:MAG TPA: HAD-IC family P-type ATPase, partial [Pirellulaceae bacterium]
VKNPILEARGDLEASANKSHPGLDHLSGNQESPDLLDADVEAVDEVAIDSLEVGDVILARAHERIAADSEVVAGRSFVDESLITGEALPKAKHRGDAVYAGTMNLDGPLRLRVSVDPALGVVRRVAQLVESARSHPAEMERLVDRFAAWYTPAIIGIAILVAVVGPFMATWLGADGDSAGPLAWLHRGLVVLVIACPCAFVIATPLTVACGLHRAAQLGAIVKGAVFLERLGTADTLAFDKTGTLTASALRVRTVHPVGGASADDLLRWSAALERHSNHPLALAVVAAAGERHLSIPESRELSQEPGQGVRGTVEERRMAVGSSHFLTGLGIQVPPFDAGSHSVATSAWVAVGCDEEFLGWIEIGVESKPETAAALRGLRRLGFRDLLLLTGDREESALALAREVGISQVRFGLLPQGKADV